MLYLLATQVTEVRCQDEEGVIKDPETIDEVYMLVYAYLDGWNGV